MMKINERNQDHADFYLTVENLIVFVQILFTKKAHPKKIGTKSKLLANRKFAENRQLKYLRIM